VKVAFLGGGVIARLALERMQAGALGDFVPVAILGRSERSKARDLAAQYRIAYVLDRGALLSLKPHVVVEAASHDAVREHAGPLLEAGVSLILLSGGALHDDALRHRLERLAEEKGASLYVPSGGIGGLDALKAVVAAGCERVEIAVTKPPAAWKNIPYVERLGVDLDRLDGPRVLFDGTAREGVPHFPQNVNIAAVLSMAGIGFDRTRLKVVADPALKLNTHYINVRGKTGTVSLKFESVPFPDNPKTAMLACFSALAALKEFRGRVRYGT